MDNIADFIWHYDDDDDDTGVREIVIVHAFAPANMHLQRSMCIIYLFPKLILIGLWVHLATNQT